jgi:hypothetical protein
MSKAVGLWVDSVIADFQDAVHQGTCVGDLHSMCNQSESMVPSVAMGSNDLLKQCS